MVVVKSVVARRPISPWFASHQTGNYIVQSVESCSDPTGCGQWIGSLANLWRTNSDIQSTFASVLANIKANNGMASVAKPGNFNE